MKNSRLSPVKPNQEPDPVVYSRPVVSALWCYAAAAAILAAFLTVAAILKSSSDGVTFHTGDQIAIAGVGLAVAGLAILPTRPRMIADADGVRTRGILGNYRWVPWSLVTSVDFRPRWRWARLGLPADESISLYAVQRWDGQRSVETMRRLRELHACATARP
ncbi:MAG: hypothetical protein JWM76_1755 [Pseudonocardiales bacterium]|nr:hypothetical protein [Pseudonocardiales bacterium]